MTKEARKIIEKDYKRYTDLASYSEENREIYQKIANLLSKFLEK